MKNHFKTNCKSAGHDDTCHVAQWGELDLIHGAGRLRLFAYANKAAFEAGKPSTCNRDVTVKFADLTKFEPLWVELATMLLTNPSSEFAGGTLEDAEQPGGAT
jgi:hypothetical protein